MPLGVNVTPTVQVALGATAAPVQVFEAAEKSPGFVPENDTAVMCRAALPLLVTVTTIGALVVFFVVSGKFNGPTGDIPTVGTSGPRVQVKIFCVAVMAPVPPVNPA